MPDKYRSISTNVIVSLALVTTLVLLAFGAVNYYRQRAELYEQLAEELDFSASQLAGYLTAPVWQLDSLLQDDIVRDAMLNQRIYAVELWVVSDYVAPHQIWTRDADGNVVQSDEMPQRPDLISEKRTILHLDEEIGEVRLVMSTRFLQKALARTLLTNATAILVLTSILLTVLLLVIRKSVIKPLQYVEQYADHISLGKAPAAMEQVSLSRELWTTMNALDAMVAGLRRAEAEYRSLFENALEGIYRFSLEGKILTVNTAMCRLLGFEDPEALLRHSPIAWEYLLFDEQRIWTLETLKEHGKVTNYEVAFRRKDGQTVWCLVNGRLVIDPDGGPPVVEGLATDITDRRSAQAQLAQLNRNLEDRIHERTADLEAANLELQKAMRQADAANKAKGDFLARMSHEIRTPLNAVIGLTNLALKTQLSDTQRNYLFKVRDSANHLLHVINDILDFSKIEAGKFSLTPGNFLLNQLFDELGDMFEVRAAEKQIELSLMIGKSVPLALVGDVVRLRQVLINLIGNAIKFTEQGNVSLKATVEPKEIRGNQEHITLHFSVRDSGIGIPIEQQQMLFSPFTQAEGAMTRRYGGTGLGLTISKRLVSLMGGDIRVESEQGKGSTFSFSVILGLQHEGEQRTLTPPPDLQGKRALIVDDNEAARLIYAEMVDSFSLRQNVAESGQDAIDELVAAHAQKDPYSLVLLDWRMEGLNGIETARKIRDLSGLSPQPIILLTTMYGRDAFFQRMATEEKAIDGLLHKPLNSSELFNAIMESFDSRESVVPRKRQRVSQDFSSEVAFIAGARVLLVEDNLINQEVATIILNGAGLRVEIASNGREALEKLSALDEEQQQWYDAVLMDVQMPEMDGNEATRIIRRNERWKELPIIAMTAHALKGDRETCLEAGMNDFVAKPIEEDALFQALLRWIKPRKQMEGSADLSSSSGQEGGPPLERASGSGLDITAGLERFKGNIRVYFNMLKHFEETGREADPAIRDEIASGAYVEAERRVHSIKGISGNLGLDEVYAASLALDDALKAEQRETVLGLFETFSRTLNKVLEAIAGLELPEEPGTSETAGELDYQALLEVMARLEDELMKSSSRARHSCSDLRRLLGGHDAYARELKQLEDSIFRLETENALEMLYAIAQMLDFILPGKETK